MGSEKYRFRGVSRLLVVTVSALAFLPAGLAAQDLSARDSRGRDVRLSSPARRIVSLSPAATETLFAIGSGASVAGVTLFCDWPPEAAALPKVGGYAAQTISLERVISLRPDLVVTDGAVHASVRDSLERKGVKVFVFEPANVEETLASMENLGTLTGNAEKAAAAAEDIRRSFAIIAERIQAVPPESRPRVFWEVSASPLMTCGALSFLHDLLTRAGGVNVFGDVQAAWPLITSEEVVRRAPQVILAADDLAGTTTAGDLARRPGWSRIPAVREGRVVFLPADPVSRAGPRMAQGALSIARALYPELFP